MPISDTELVELRLRYETAYDAYQSCVLAMEQRWRGCETLPADLVERHAKALRELNAERARYRDALVQVAFISDDPPQ